MTKTVVVQREYDVFVPKYNRYMKRRSRISAHAPPCLDLEVGDHVTIAETRRISKTKSHVVVERTSSQSSPQSRISVHEGDNYLRLSIDGRDMYSLKEYDGFYGVYWQSEFNVGEFLSGIPKLVQSYHSSTSPQITENEDALRESIVDGVLVQDFTDEIKLSADEIQNLLKLNRNFADEASSDVSASLAGRVAKIEPSKEITFLRLNFRKVNVSWERNKSGVRIGVLSDQTSNESLCEFMFESAFGNAGSPEGIVSEMSEEVKRQTQNYA